MYKIYQLQQINIKEDIKENGKVKEYTYDVQMNVIGEYKVHKRVKTSSLVDVLWDSCNVGCWDNSWEGNEPVIKEEATFYPKEAFRGYCNSDVVVETKYGLYLAKSFGWTKVKDLEEAMYRIIWSNTFFRWNEIRDKSKLDKEKLIKIGNIINEERARERHD